MRVRLISFGTNWWAMHSHDTSDPYCFRRRAAWFNAAAYSALDEIHQSFVASRTASALDSLLDSTGALVALVVLFLFYRLFLRSRPA